MSSDNKFDQDPISFLRDKVLYHKEQIKAANELVKLHKRLMEDTKEKLSKLGSPFDDSSVEETPTIQLFPDTVNLKMKKLKPVVRQILIDAKSPMSTDEIINKISTDISKNSQLRRKAVMAVSNALQSFKRENEIDIHDNDGRGNKYSIKNPQSKASGGS